MELLKSRRKQIAHGLRPRQQTLAETNERCSFTQKRKYVHGPRTLPPSQAELSVRLMGPNLAVYISISKK